MAWLPYSALRRVQDLWYRRKHRAWVGLSRVDGHIGNRDGALRRQQTAGARQVPREVRERVQGWPQCRARREQGPAERARSSGGHRDGSGSLRLLQGISRGRMEPLPALRHRGGPAVTDNAVELTAPFPSLQARRATPRTRWP